ncbi:LRR receptor-like kinase resistance protein, partial [Trifolium pratense]
RTLTMAQGNQTDHLALLQFKQLISSDPYGILDSWNSSTHFCKWHGIICSPKHQRVTRLTLEGNKLHGSISPYVGNLSHMRFLNLQNNSFYGKIPQELGRLFRLRYLFLNNNSFSGEFPINLTNCSELITMHLAADNNFNGSLPHNMFHTLPNLQFFSIGVNSFSGHIPTSIANASTLTVLVIPTNHFVGQVPNLGAIPSFIGNLSQLYALRLDGNMFEGDIPETIGECISLEYLYLEGNSFRGTIPSSLASLKGEVPTDGVFGNATQVAIIGNNKLCGGISQLHLPPCLIKDGFSPRNLIGSGSFGSVYRGNLVSEDNVIAVKITKAKNLKL